MAIKTRKVKVGPMSEARKAIFARFNCEEAQAAELHRQLTTQYDQLVKLYAETAALAFTDDRETNGNLILVEHFERVKASEERAVSRIQAANRQAGPFQRVFKVRLSRYFNPFYGFKVAQFDVDVVKSPRGKAAKTLFAANGAKRGLAIVMDLMQ